MKLLERESAFTYNINIFVLRPMQPQSPTFTVFVFYGGRRPGRSRARAQPGLAAAQVLSCPSPRWPHGLPHLGRACLPRPGSLARAPHGAHWTSGGPVWV